MNKQTQNRTLHAAGVALVIAGAVVAADARDARTTLTVSATVNAVASLESQSAPADLEISAADVARGFVEVSEPTMLRVRSNSPAGFALDLMTVTPLASSIVVRGLGSDQFLGADGGTIIQRWQAPHAVNLSLQFRLVLAPGLAAGRYPWPMRVAVRPLDAV